MRFHRRAVVIGRFDTVHLSTVSLVLQFVTVFLAAAAKGAAAAAADRTQPVFHVPDCDWEVFWLRLCPLASALTLTSTKGGRPFG